MSLSTQQQPSQCPLRSCRSPTILHLFSSFICSQSFPLSLFSDLPIYPSTISPSLSSSIDCRLSSSIFVLAELDAEERRQHLLRMTLLHTTLVTVCHRMFAIAHIRVIMRLLLSTVCTCIWHVRHGTRAAVRASRHVHARYVHTSHANAHKWSYVVRTRSLTHPRTHTSPVVWGL